MDEPSRYGRSARIRPLLRAAELRERRERPWPVAAGLPLSSAGLPIVLAGEEALCDQARQAVLSSLVKWRGLKRVSSLLFASRRPGQPAKWPGAVLRAPRWDSLFVHRGLFQDLLLRAESAERRPIDLLVVSDLSHVPRPAPSNEKMPTLQQRLTASLPRLYRLARDWGTAVLAFWPIDDKSGDLLPLVAETALLYRLSTADTVLQASDDAGAVHIIRP